MSKTFEGGGFDDRDRWALKMQAEYAVPIYREYWAVGDDDITEVDKCGKTEDAARVFDTMGGTDKAITPSTGMRHVAQRFRTRTQSDDGYVYSTDFSIRTSSYTGADTEYDKLLNAYRNDGNVPAIYSFGVADAFNKPDALEAGFRDFYFLDLERFLKLVDNNQLEPVSCYPNGDGSEALYFSVDSLRDTGIIRDEIHGDVLSSAWRGVQTSNEFATAPGVKTTGQVDLLSFGDSDE